MTLPASGQLGMGDIRNELQVISQSPFSLSGATMGAYAVLNNCSPVKPNQTTPYQISEWYSYCHLCACNVFCLTSGSTSCNCTGCCNQCGAGYVPANDGTANCVKIQTLSDTAPTTPNLLTHWTCDTTAKINYSVYGSLFYNAGYNTGGYGTIAYTATTADVWKNDLTNQCDYGPLLREMIWTQSGSGGDPTGRWVCHTACFTASTATTKTYYVGIAGDNYFRLVLDGTEIVNSSLSVWNASTDAFKWWHVYPVSITAGAHTLRICGYNDGSIAAFGCEIYDNTLQSLTAATSVNALNMIYRTISYVGQNFTAIYDTGLNATTIASSSSYTCSDTSYTYNPCYSDCVKTVTCTPATPTPTPSPSATLTATPTPSPSPSPSATLTATPTPSSTSAPSCTTCTYYYIDNTASPFSTSVVTYDCNSPCTIIYVNLFAYESGYYCSCDDCGYPYAQTGGPTIENIASCY